MKFSCGKKAFSDAVNVIQRTVSTKSTLPALEGILIKAASDSLTLTSNDLEIGMTTNIPAKVSEPGDIVLNAKLFSEILRKLPAESVELTADEKLLTTVTSGVAEFTILGIPASEFPETPALSECENFAIAQNILAGMIRQTLFCISSDDSKPVHTGSLFELSDGEIRIVSVDGFRLAIRTEKIQNSMSLKFVVPGKTLSEVLKMLSPDNDEQIHMSIGKRHILFEINGFTIISRLLEGDFLDYHSVIVNKSSTEIKINVRGFTGSIERASLLISERLKSPVRCVFEKGLIKVTCSTASGKVYDEIPSTLTGETLEMGFNNRYLLDALRACECDEIRVLLNGPLSPMRIYPVNGEEFIFLVLPVRLKTDA
jgi:DNA polymerase III subunit beta